MVKITVVLVATMVVYFCFVGCGSLVGMGSGAKETKAETPTKKPAEKASAKVEEVKKQAEPSSVKSESKNHTKPKSDSQPKTVDPKSLIPFSAESVTPEHREVGSPVDSRIIVDFNKPIDQSTINAGTFTVSGAVSGPASGMFIFSSGSNTGRVVFTPDLDFIAGEMVTVTLSQNIKDIAGNALSWSDIISDGDYRWRFVTDTGGHSVIFTDSGQHIDGHGFATSLVLADSDADGDLDAFLTNVQNGVNRVLINNSLAIFDRIVIINDIPSNNLAVGDLNGDGISDLLIHDLRVAGVAVLRGLMGGHAGMQALGGYLCEGWTQFHLNMPVHCLLGDDTGIFSTILDDPDVDGQIYDQIRAQPDSLELKDMDGDGDLDPVIGWDWDSRCRESDFCRPSYWDGVTWESFELPWVWLNTPYLVSGAAVSETTVDFRGSTTAFNMIPPGVVVANEGSCCDGTRGIEIGDLDGDGDLDMVTLSSNMETHSDAQGIVSRDTHNLMRVSINHSSVPDSMLEFSPENSEIPFTLPSENSRYPGVTYVHRDLGAVTFEVVKLGDVDGDGDLDALIAGSAGAIVLFNQGFGSFSFNDQLIHEYPVSDAALGDLDGDGDLDAAFTGYKPIMDHLLDYESVPNYPFQSSDRRNRIFLNNGFGFFTDSLLTMGEGQSTHISLGDLDLDGDLDAFIRNQDPFATTNSWRNHSTVWLNNTPPLYQVPPISIGEAQPSGPSTTDRPSTSGIGIASVLPSPTTTPTESGLPSESGIGIAAALPLGQPSSGSSPTSPPEETPSEIASNWVIETIESSEDVGQYSSMDYQLSNSGESTLHIVYLNSDSAKLKYKKYDTNTGLHTMPETPANYDDFGPYADISVLEDGKKHVSYYTIDPGADLGFSESMESVEGWQWWGVDMGPDDVGQHTGIVVDSNGAPHIAYYDVTNNSLKHAWGDFQSSNYIWHIETVDSGGVGQYANLAIDNSDNLHIAYYSTQGSLKHGYGTQTTGGWNWSVDTAVAGSSGEYSSIALDSSGNPHVVYFDSANGSLKHAWANWNQSLGEWEWQSQQVDSGLGNSVGSHASLVVGIDGLHVAYYDDTRQSLKYAHAPAMLVVDDLWFWFPITIEDTGDDVGKYTDIALDDSGTVYIIYYDETNGDLKLAHN